MRLPKARGFTHARRIDYVEVSLDQLERLAVGKVTNAGLKKANLTKTELCSVKVLGNGKLSKKLSVELQAATASAIAAIEKAGGSFIATDLPQKKTANKATGK
jgi:large subunit ribosomal protein L15